MESLRSLIDEAARVCGGYAALARALETTPQRVDQWKHGKRPITPETVALMCDLMQLPGEEARRLAALAIIENPKNAERAGVLRRAFFVCLATGGVALPQLFGTTSHEGSDRRTVDTAIIVACLLLWHYAHRRWALQSAKPRSITRAG